MSTLLNVLQGVAVDSCDSLFSSGSYMTVRSYGNNPIILDQSTAFTLSLWVLIIFTTPLNGQQLILDENFEDQDLGAWTGDTGHFSFFDEDGNTRLWLNAPSAGTSQLRTPSSTAYGSWDFFIDQDFAPSDGNRGFIFLVSDIEDLSGDVNGYAVRSGENGSGDRFRLFRFDDGNPTEILAGSEDLSDGGPFQIRVIREDDGSWHLYESAGYGTEPVLSGSITDNSIASSAYFGLLLDYTATRSDKFYFDDIRIENNASFSASHTELVNAVQTDVHFNYEIDENSVSPMGFYVNGGIGTPQEAELITEFIIRLTFQEAFPEGDHTITVNEIENIYGGEIDQDFQLGFSVKNPFKVVEVSTQAGGKIEIEFTEELDSPDPSDFSLSGAGSPDHTAQPEPGVIELTYDTPLDAGEYELDITGVQSVDGWNLEGSDSFDLFVFDEYQDGDLLITEFFYRPPSGWRTAEFDRPRYVELHNRSDRLLNLRNWTLNDENISPGSDIRIAPDEYLVITRGEPVFREQFGNRNFVEAEDFPSFSLTTDNKIVLKNQSDSIVDSLHYDAGLWGGNGVALERNSTDVPAHFKDNWGESQDALLGSPGLSNTLRAPTEPPFIEEVATPVPGLVRVIFSGTLSEPSLDLANFSLSHNISFSALDYRSAEHILELETTEDLEDGVAYTFSWNNVEDIFGNSINSEQEYSFTFQNPFMIMSAEVENDNQLIVEFTQPLDVITVSAADFRLADNTPPESLEFLTSEKIRLKFEEGFPVGRYSIHAKDFDSMTGWPIEEDTFFTFYVFDEAEPGDILINELMYNPPDRYSPYVELYNNSDKLLNLKNRELRRQEGGSPNGGIISETDVPLEPGEYLVITSDSIPLNEIFGNRPWLEMSSFPAFTVQNEGSVRLTDASGAVMDSLQYVPSEWGGSQVALERKSAGVSAEYAENWGESPHELLGTPGVQNAIPPDTSAPVLQDFEITGDGYFILSFDEQLDAESAADLDNYEISPTLTISLVMVVNSQVILLTEEELTDGREYQVLADGVKDLFGNRMDSETLAYQYLEFSEAEAGQLVINEILYRRLESGSPEFVEIYNLSEENINLTGWTLNDSGGSTDIPENTIILPDQYLVFTDTENAASGNEQVIYLPGFQSLSNNGDAVVLKNERESVIDSVYYLPDWGNNIRGISLERKDPSAVSLDKSNWAPSTAEDGSTPASENSRFEPDHTPPEIIFANLYHPDSLEVQFNKFIDLRENREKVPADSGPVEENPTVKTQKNFSLHHNTTNRNIQFLINENEADILQYNPEKANYVILDASEIEAGEEIELQINNISDFQGNLRSAQTISVAQPLAEGDVVINEIMYQPLADSHDNLPDQTDYIELYNRQSYAISLEGIYLHDEPDELGEISLMEPVTTASAWIPANGYMLLYPAAEPGTLEETSLGEFFELTKEHDQFSLRFDRSTLSLPQAGRKIYLADSTGTTLDMVDYRPDWHNPNLTDTRGIALERIHPGMESNDATNWGSNPLPTGGTPGAENTLYQDAGLIPDGTGISLEPNPFSPDDDGYDDNLFIHYTFDEPDYLLRIRIYDRYGRLVRKLADGTPAGFRGSLIWDGRTDNGGRNRIGIYIIYAEAFNSANGKNLSFKETVVVARQF